VIPGLAEEHAKNKYSPLDKLRAWQRFHIRLTGLYGGTVFVALALLAIVFFKIGIDEELLALQKRLLAMVESLAASIDAEKIKAIPVDSPTLTPFHEELLQRLEQVASSDPDVETVYILRPTEEPTKLRFLVDFVKDGVHGNPGELYDASDVPILLKGFVKPIAEDQLYTDEFGTTLSGYAPIMTEDGHSVALVGADVQADRIYQMKNEVLLTTVSAFGVAAVLIGLVSLIVARSVRQPLTEIISAANAVSRGELDTRIATRRRDEFGIMSQQFDFMTEGLRDREFLRQTFGQYMSEEVAKALLDANNRPQLGGEERVVTVMFSDLRGYSTICERLPPVQVVNMLNQYLGAMNTIIHEHQGCVIEFFGDAILAVFGAPYYIADHSEQAVRCALSMRQRLNELNQEWNKSDFSRFWKQGNIESLSARIGIHSGKVVAGNLGSPTRMKYAVIGDTVNVASRLEEMNKELDTDILLSEDVYAHLPEDILNMAADQGEHKVKGREQMVRVYSI
jgi:adenylate cyclase